MAVCEAAGDGRDRCADGAENAEAAGDACAEVVVGRAEEEDDGGPEGAEGGEDQAADGGGFNQQRLGADERPEGAQGLAVRHGGARRQEREGAAEKECQRDGEMTDAMTKTQRQLSHSPIHPEKVRLSRMPRSRPVMTEPTARPALAGVAISGAMGSITWVTAAMAPVRMVTSTMGRREGTAAVRSMARTRPAIILRMRPRRSSDIAEGHEEEQSDGVAGLCGDGDLAHAAPQ